jgi:hypothetical protein
MKHQLNKGYVGYRVIYDALVEGGMTNDASLLASLGKAYPANLKDPQLLNAAIASALRVPPPDNASFKDNSLMRIDEADPGLVDYYKIAFHLFGFNTESFFHLYFVLLSISVVIFLMAHHQSMAFMTVPVLFLAAGNIVLSSDIFSIGDQLVSVVNLRFLSTLGLLPALHLVLLMLERQQITFVRAGLAVAQIVLLLFVFSIRSTITWVLPLFFMIASTQLILGIIKLKRQNIGFARAFRASTKTLLVTGWWPLAALLAGFFIFQTLMSVRMHPSYELDDALPHHYRINNAFIGLTAHPMWGQTFAKDYGFAKGDELGLRAGVNYFVTHYDQPETLYRSPLTGEVKSGLHERMVRGAYFAFIQQHPWFVIEAHFAKTYRLFGMLWNFFTQSVVSKSVPLVVLLATIVAGVVAAAEGPSLLSRVKQLVIVSASGIFFSWLVVLGDPWPWIIGDQLWMVSFGFMTACWVVLTVMLLLTRQPRRTRMPEL